jgi:hypothetical protein|tara:strand:- start:3556 stop:3663 length:108 start_codon:yes stop_codon:yes gene_type:complete
MRMRKKRRKISSQRFSLSKKTFEEKERVPLMMKRT